MKVGIIRCQQTEDMCPGTKCLGGAREGKDAFQGSAGAEVVGFLSCGGCPGKKAVARAMEMEKRGAETIFLASCATRGIPWEYPCPHQEQIKTSLRKKLNAKTKIVDWTHA
jgi:predicted metal-binding protein